MTSIDQKYDVVVARVVDAHGVRGQVKVQPFTESAANLSQFQEWCLASPGSVSTVVNLTDSRVHGKFVIAQFEEFSDRDQALAVKGADVRVDSTTFPELADGHYYWKDLIGLKVVVTEIGEIGIVSSMMETGANDVLVVTGDRDRLIPYIAEVVKEVDLEKGTVLVDWDVDF